MGTGKRETQAFGGGFIHTLYIYEGVLGSAYMFAITRKNQYYKNT